MTGTLLVRLLGLMTSVGFGFLVLDYHGAGEQVCHPMSGVVRLDGRPLAQGAIRFMPVGLTRSVGAAAKIVEGAYEISVYDGLPAGKYQVCFSGLSIEDSLRMHDHKDDAAAPLVDPVPARFNWQSQIFVEVAEDGGTLGFDFDLKK